MNKSRMLVNNAPEGDLKATHFNGSYVIAYPDGHILKKYKGEGWIDVSHRAWIVDGSCIELDHSAAEDNPAHWDGRTAMSEGDIYLDSDGQLCKLLVEIAGKNETMCIGHAYEHPDNQGVPCISTSPSSDCTTVGVSNGESND